MKMKKRLLTVLIFLLTVCTLCGVISACFSLGNVDAASSAHYGRFNENNNGNISNCHYAADCKLFFKGAEAEESPDTSKTVAKDVLLSYDFLVNELFWEPDIWNITENGCPTLH